MRLPNYQIVNCANGVRLESKWKAIFPLLKLVDFGAYMFFIIIRYDRLVLWASVS